MAASALDCAAVSRSGGGEAGSTAKGSRTRSAFRDRRDAALHQGPHHGIAESKLVHDVPHLRSATRRLERLVQRPAAGAIAGRARRARSRCADRRPARATRSVAVPMSVSGGSIRSATASTRARRSSASHTGRRRARASEETGASPPFRSSHATISPASPPAGAGPCERRDHPRLAPHAGREHAPQREADRGAVVGGDPFAGSQKPGRNRRLGIGSGENVARRGLGRGRVHGGRDAHQLAAAHGHDDSRARDDPVGQRVGNAVGVRWASGSGSATRANRSVISAGRPGRDRWEA